MISTDKFQQPMKNLASYFSPVILMNKSRSLDNCHLFTSMDIKKRLSTSQLREILARPSRKLDENLPMFSRGDPSPVDEFLLALKISFLPQDQKFNVKVKFRMGHKTFDKHFGHSYSPKQKKKCLTITDANQWGQEFLYIFAS